MVSCMPFLIKEPENRGVPEMRLIGQLTFISRITGSLTGWSGENLPNTPLIFCRHCSALELDYLSLLVVK